MAANLHLHENAKLVVGQVPLDITGAGFNGDWVSLKNYRCCNIVLMCGAWAGGTAAVTVEQATAVAGTSNKAVSFAYKWEGTALTDDNLARVAVTSDTFNLDTANEFHVIPIFASMLDADNGFDCVRVVVATPGANADLAACLYILTQPRYSQADPPSAIVD